MERCPIKELPEDNKNNMDLAYTTAAVSCCRAVTSLSRATRGSVLCKAMSDTAGPG